MSAYTFALARSQKVFNLNIVPVFERFEESDIERLQLVGSMDRKGDHEYTIFSGQLDCLQVLAVTCVSVQNKQVFVVIAWLYTINKVL